MRVMEPVVPTSTNASPVITTATKSANNVKTRQAVTLAKTACSTAIAELMTKTPPRPFAAATAVWVVARTVIAASILTSPYALRATEVR